ncbi:MAG TPA: hypothetical protein VGM88_09960 [Kofleriaceae bacterium]|jgi:hypothetical protein
MPDPAGTPALIDAIRHMHGVEATFVESVPVRETFQGEVVWDGEVQVFGVVHPSGATRAYAWSYATEGTKRRFVAVLGLGPVVDAVTAVRAAIASGKRS